MNRVIDVLPIVIIILDLLFLMVAVDRLFDSRFERNIMKIVVGAALVIVNVVFLFSIN